VVNESLAHWIIFCFSLFKGISMQKGKSKKKIHPEQVQPKPGLEERMYPHPQFETEAYGPGKMLDGKVALITGGDSGIGRAIAVCFARHGANVAIGYLKSEEKDAKITRAHVEQHGQKCLLVPGDIRDEKFCRKVVEKTVKEFKKLDILVNNAATHYPKEKIQDISATQLRETFEVNVFSMFYLVKAALQYLKEGSSIINTASVVAYRGSANLLDYSATKGAVVAYTRSLAHALADKKIRVNAVAPGPVWTPLIVSSLKAEQVAVFGSDSPMGRAGEPAEIAPAYLFLASEGASFISGQVIHPNGGEIVNG
jgi:NAD(P)-dependent dehydrogenase (short-subunit alcohol dehydrogenase family)